MSTTAPKRGFRALIGASFLSVLVVLTYVTIGLFTQSFDSTTNITVDTSRAGLLMDKGASVKLRGVQIGRVTKIDLRPDDTVELTLGIEPDQFKHIASNVTANIIPPTVFGAKYVELVPPAYSAGRIQAGAALTAQHVNVEINQAFSHLVDLLGAAQPAKVSRALNAFATVLKDNGDRTGNLIVLADRYLQQLNPSLHSLLPEDVTKGSQVTGNLAKDIVPGLIKVASNGGYVSDTLVNSQATLAAVLSNITTFGNKTTTFINTIRPTLRTAVTYLEPTTRLLQEYSSILPCTINGLNNLRKTIEPIAGGTDGLLRLDVQILPSDDPYKNPKDLPVVGATNSPDCFGLPSPTPGRVLPAKTYDVGTNPAVGRVPNGGAAGTPGGGGGAPGQTLNGLLTGLLGAGSK